MLKRFVHRVHISVMVLYWILSRDPRWSRVEETFGEDPVLSGRLGAAMVIGLGSGDYPVNMLLSLP